MTFDPQQHLTKIKGKDYLEVKYRIQWFRDRYPVESGWGIRTELISVDPIIAKASIVNPDGVIIATGHATAQAGGNTTYADRPFEKAETSAIGRALGAAGFGTQFSYEEEADGELADSPVDRSNGNSPPQKEQHTDSDGDHPDTGKVIDITIDQIEVAETKTGKPFLKCRALDGDGNKVLVSSFTRQPFADKGFVDTDENSNDWTVIGEVIDFKPEITAKAMYNNKGYLNVHEITTDFLTWEKQGGLMVAPDTPF